MHVLLYQQFYTITLVVLCSKPTIVDHSIEIGLLFLIKILMDVRIIAFQCNGHVSLFIQKTSPAG